MSLSTRSWTDAVTNAALFARFDAAEYFAWLSGRGIRVDRALTQFLHEFTGDIAWCHLDIGDSGFSSKASGEINKGCTGAMVRTLLELLMSWQ